MGLQAYFQAYRNYFWQWEDSTEILAIPNGRTIAYKAFVLEVMEQISPTGTPPFGALLFMLIATNPTAKSDLEQIKEKFFQSLSEKDNKTGYHNQAFDFLIKIQSLPDAYKTGIKRILLLQTVFKGSHNHLSHKKTKQILRAYESRKDEFPHLILSQEKSFSIDALYIDFRVFQYLNSKFPTAESILKALASLPIVDESIVETIPEEPTENIDPDLLLEQLKEEPETSLVAALVKHLWSGLNIPFQKLSPNEQPLGGISDITNKGNFDRLLISEFAYDNLSFLSRLANNEALYLHREAPPAANHLERIILIDVSLKNWGTPRTIAYAILYALAYHPKAKTACTAYAVGGQLITKQLQFNDLDAIINSLQHLDASLDCSKGLNFFLNSIELTKQSEIIYIGAQEATQSTAFREAIHSYESYFKYWVYPNSEGLIKVYKNKHKTKKHAQTILLPLEKLWQDKKTVTPIRAEVTEGHHSPILLPQPLEVKQVLSTVDEEVFMVTKSKDLLCFAGEKHLYGKKGWELMYHALPFSSGVFEIGLTNDGSYILLVFDLQTRMLSLINCQTKEMKQVHFNNWVSGTRRRFLFHQDVFYYFARNKCWSFDFYTDEIITESLRPANSFDFYDQREETLKDLSAKLGYASNLLKNIKTVELNINGDLVFNGKHALLLNPYGVIKLELSTTQKDKDQHEARNSLKKRVFVFNDGSKIQVNSYGTILLISSDSSLPVIHVPLVLNAALGIGTEDCFAGNDYYLRPSNSGGLAIMKTKKFWETFMQPFIETIKTHVST
jgi:hypothetical protein